MRPFLLFVLLVAAALSGEAQAGSSGQAAGDAGLSMTWTVRTVDGDHRFVDATIKISGVVLTAEEVVVKPSRLKGGDPVIELRGNVQLVGATQAVQMLCASQQGSGCQPR